MYWKKKKKNEKCNSSLKILGHFSPSLPALPRSLLGPFGSKACTAPLPSASPQLSPLSTLLCLGPAAAPCSSACCLPTRLFLPKDPNTRRRWPVVAARQGRGTLQRRRAARVRRWPCGEKAAGACCHGVAEGRPRRLPAGGAGGWGYGAGDRGQGGGACGQAAGIE